MAHFIPGQQRQWQSQRAMDLERHWPPKTGGLRFKTAPQFPYQFRIAGFPKLVPRTNPAQIDVALPEAESSFAGKSFGFEIDAVNPSAFLLLFRFSGVE